MTNWVANYGVHSDKKLLMFQAIPKDLHTILLEDLSGAT